MANCKFCGKEISWLKEKRKFTLSNLMVASMNVKNLKTVEQQRL